MYKKNYIPFIRSGASFTVLSLSTRRYNDSGHGSFNKSIH